MASEGAPLSFAQEQLWFVDQVRPGGAEYVLHRAWRLRGPLDTAALRAALTGVAERHEVLRTRYDTSDGVAEQITDDPAPVRPREYTGGIGDVEAAERDLLAEPFDLRTGPPWRTALVHIGPDDAVLLIAVHHIAFDGWSWGVLMAELAALYAGEGLPEPLVQYADFAVWQRDLAESDGSARRLRWWCERLAGLEPLELPADRRRPAVWSADGDAVDFTVPAYLAEAATAAGRAVGATPFMTYLAAFQLLLARYTRRTDIAVGVSVAGREQVELEQLVGLFLNTVVLRTDLAGAPSFAEAATRVRAVALDAFDRQDVPFDRVVAALAQTPDLSRNPVFQVGFALHTEQGEALSLPGVDVAPHPVRPHGSPFDLSLHLLDRADGSVSARLMYPTALFDRGTVERMAENLLRLLAAVTADPGAPVDEIDLVHGGERERLAAWNDTAAPRPDATLPELIAACAETRRESVAAVSDDGWLTYGELMERVDGLARHLRERGAGAGTAVGVCLPRGLDLLIAVLAVMASGAAYVPLPPEHPPARRAAAAASSGVRLAIASAPADLPTGVDAVDPAARATGSGPLAWPGGDDAVYVMTTSGSTGRPKGVVVTHAGLRNRVLWAVEHLRIGPGERVLQKTTTGFDASVWEFLAPLVAGGVVVMASEDAHRDPAAMLGAVARHGVTVLQVVPSVLRLLVDEPALPACRSLRVVCSAGEPLPRALCERLTARLPVEVVNTYGPTECAIDATAHRYDPADTGDTVPIGRPLPNIRAHVVDLNDRLAPVGVPGELCLSGVGLARGYAGLPALTAERFTPDPHSRVPGARLYRTGDLARFREDGALEFLGRLDRQVKVRGVRVEPAEVEAALLTHPAVAAAAVVPTTAGGDTTLTAYVVPAGAPAPDDALRDHVADALPAAMVPSAVVTLDALAALPLTANGKLDHAALPAPGAPRAATGEPATDVERAVADAAAELLGRALGPDDDFFAAGGHSLLAIRLVLRLRRAFGVELAAGEVFARRTPRGIAEAVEAALRVDVPTGGTRSVRPRTAALPLSPGQRRLWFVDRLNPGTTEYLVPLAMRLRGPFAPEVFRRAVDDVVRRHEVLRTRYTEVGGEPSQLIDPPGPAEVTVLDLPGATPDALTGAASRPFDLAAEHPLRVTVVRAAPDEHLVLILVHHIAFDLWSTDLLLRELDQTYAAFAAGHPSPLPVPAVQYADIAADGPAEAAGDPGRLAYWREALAGLTPLELPADRPRPAHRDITGGHVVATVPAEVIRPLLAAGEEVGCTPFMTVLAAFQLLLSRYTGRTDIAVGTPVAGRTTPDTEDLIGFFVNHIVLRTDLGGDPGFTAVLDRVRRTALAGMANQDVPFERVVDTLSPDRDLTRNPLFQVVFELEPGAAVPATLGGAAVEPLPAGEPVAKFDLRLTTRLLPDGGLRAWFEYSAAIFDHATIDRMAGHFTRLLAGLAAAPGAPVSDVDMLSAGESAQLGRWADPDAALAAALDPPRVHPATVADMVADQARRAPAATAVVAGAERLSYAELNSRANRLAHHLRALGIGPEVVVGCCLERGAAAIVAWLAVMKSGGVYAPMDPTHPAARLAFLLDDAGARVVLTTAGFAGSFDGPRPVVLADAEHTGPEHDPEPLAGPSALAYVIYTSGSTGKPKGVMVDHRAYAHHLRVITERYRSRPRDRVLLLSALTFDVAMDQIAVPLVSGSTLVVGDARRSSPDQLLAEVRAHGITTMQIPPSLYRELVDRAALDPSALDTVDLMNVGADVVTTADARRWTELGQSGRFLYNYGPTEATVNCVVHTVDGEQPGGKAGLPLGTPLAGSPAHIVDADLRPVPIGVPGELLVGGPRLARGYHDRPALTAEKFIPDPFTPGGRLYRTGDLARWRPDGTIQFLGRIDHQVKIRGFRVELGEIEAVIARHPDVRGIVVVAKDAPTGDKRLVAYPVYRDGKTPDLRAHLSALLPDYMIPAHWHPLPTLPLTSSKKVDRKALPTPDWAGEAAHTTTPPTTTPEHLIAAIWTDVLAIPDLTPTHLSTHDDFFRRGGHSLLLTRVAAALTDTLAIDVPLRLLFDHTTISTQAAAIAGLLRTRTRTT
ncbi:amino acid adenylation domain-containing protein [Actinokineospora guangxiensis]|uniref:Amino acid adenylation domain-containing protein n=1 Tax=Actinokineospora guangxiensis TaxID=1490288 RepID=A0ABW0EGE8_9PSEU